MKPSLFMTEIAVSDWAASADWYCQHLGFHRAHVDATKGFVLLAGEGGRLALKAGQPQPGSVLLVFQVGDLSDVLSEFSSVGIQPEAEVKISAEGYQSATFRDPDGYRIELFEWTTNRG